MGGSYGPYGREQYYDQEFAEETPYFIFKKGLKSEVTLVLGKIPKEPRSTIVLMPRRSKNIQRLNVNVKNDLDLFILLKAFYNSKGSYYVY